MFPVSSSDLFLLLRLFGPRSLLPLSCNTLWGTSLYDDFSCPSVAWPNANRTNFCLVILQAHSLLSNYRSNLFDLVFFFWFVDCEFFSPRVFPLGSILPSSIFLSFFFSFLGPKL